MDKKTFEALFEHSSLGIIISNEEGIIQSSNPYASNMFGYDRNELNGKLVEDLLPANLKEKHIIYRQQYNKNPQPRAMGSNLNLTAVKKSGDEFPVEISLTYFETENGRMIISFINDITERKRVENQLIRLTEDLESKIVERTKELSDALLELGHTNEGLKLEMEQRKKVESQILGMLEREKELNELKSRFVSMASHEFRTPLGGILTSASLISKYNRPEDAPKREKHVQTIKRSVKNLTNILNDFLSLEKLEQGKVASLPSSFNLTQFIDELSEDFDETSGQIRRIQVEHSHPDVMVIQDKDLVRNVVINLLSNALKYSPDGSVINIRTKLMDDEVSLEIQDHGIGIPDEDQKHLFERFFRAANVINLQGTGLGLNIVQRYLEMMDGRIEFVSKLNVGTTFKVIIPVEKK